MNETEGKRNMLIWEFDNSPSYSISETPGESSDKISIKTKAKHKKSTASPVDCQLNCSVALYQNYLLSGMQRKVTKENNQEGLIK